MPERSPFEDDETCRVSLPQVGAIEEEIEIPVLRIIQGNQVGRVIPVDGPSLVIGRGADADLTVDDNGVSRRHAHFIRLSDGALTVNDLGSTNGTLVNDEQVTAKMLAIGDVISLGGVVNLQLEMMRVRAGE